MSSRSKQILLRYLPSSLVAAMVNRKAVMAMPRLMLIQNQLRQIRPVAESLGMAELARLQGEFPMPAPYPYDESALTIRAQQKCAEVLWMCEDDRYVHKSFLELGCADGMVCVALMQQGKTVIGVDFRGDQFHVKAREAGADLREMDATHLSFDDGTFDCIYSYDAFEHFFDPKAVLREAHRVLRPGGFLFLSYGPLYMAPMGLHAYESIPVPYCQILFSREEMECFTRDHGLAPIPFDSVNGWTLAQYQALWREMAGGLKIASRVEKLDLGHLAMISRYPGHFAARSRDLKEYLVSSVSIAFRKL